MKADLYTAPAHAIGGSGLAHRTDAGFVIITSADGDAMLELIDAHQHEADLIDQVVAKAQTDSPTAFAMVFTAGGELYLIACGAASAHLVSESSDLNFRSRPGQVLVYPVGAGLNEADANLRLALDEVRPLVTVEDLRSGTIVASAIELAIGAASLPSPVTPAQEPVGHAPPAVAAAAEPEPEPAAPIVPEQQPELATPEPEASVTPEAAAPEPTTPEPEATTPLAPSAEPAPAEPAPDEPIVPVEPEQQPEQQSEPEPQPVVGAPAAPVTVLGLSCPQGHHNHPDASYCSQCGTKMGVHQTTVLVNGPRPPLGVLVVDDGTTYSLNGDLVIGREPTTHADVIAGAAAAMILTDDTLAMSRQHARIRLDDWSVLVADLNSSNGTFLRRTGQPETWAQVPSGATVPLEPGDQLRIGGRIIQVELHHVG